MGIGVHVSVLRILDNLAPSEYARIGRGIRRWKKEGYDVDHVGHDGRGMIYDVWITRPDLITPDDVAARMMGLAGRRLRYEVAELPTQFQPQ